MNQLDLIKAAKDFSKRAQKKGQLGTNLTMMQIKEIQENSNVKLPQWYEELVSKTSILGIECSFHEKEPKSEWRYYKMKIANSVEIKNETFESYPGYEIVKQGLICFATSNLGSDPYFVELNETPKLFQCYHDVDYSIQEKMESDSELITQNLINFFENAEIE